MVKKGQIVYFDGPDGVGKTTQIKLVEAALLEKGHSVKVEHALGGTPIGDKLKEVIFSNLERPADTNMHIAMAIQHAFSARLLRLRDEGNVILIDRSPLSIVAYQAYGDGLSKEKALNAARELFDLIQPNLVLVYKAGYDELDRRRQRQRDEHKDSDHFDKKPPDYHHRVAEGFEAAASEFNAVMIDASAGPQSVFADTLSVLLHLFA